MTHPYLRLNLTSATPGHALTSSDLIESLGRKLVSERGTAAGCRLPPVRVLAHDLGISHTTVQAAYAELVARGLVLSRERVGLFVAPPESAASPIRQDPVPVPALKAAPAAGPAIRPADPSRAISLSSVFIDPELLPTRRLLNCYRSVLAQPGLSSTSDLQGLAPLRRIISERLVRRGIDADPAHIVITSGSQQALDCVCRVLESRVVAVENPSYAVACGLLEVNGMEPVALPVSPFAGIDMEEWERRLEESRPALLLLTANYQNPTSYSYTSDELRQIGDQARRYRFGILEDDWGSDMMPYSDFRPSLRAQGGDGVFYVNSFTRKVLPSLRLGYVVGNEQTTPLLAGAKYASTLGMSALNEAVLFEFLDRGYYDTHLSQLQQELDRRYAACLETLRQTMPEGVTWTTPGGGMSVWIEFPRHVDLQQVQMRLADRSVLMGSGDGYYLGECHLNGTRIGYGYLPPEALQRGLEVLAAELKRWLP